jgi:hypothetical protein
MHLAILSLKFMIRVTLIASICLLLISCALRVICGSVTFESYNSVYNAVPLRSMFLGMYTISGAVPGLIIVSLYNMRKRRTSSWPFIKKEIVLLAVTSICVLLFALLVKN